MGDITTMSTPYMLLLLLVMSFEYIECKTKTKTYLVKTADNVESQESQYNIDYNTVKNPVSKKEKSRSKFRSKNLAADIGSHGSSCLCGVSNKPRKKFRLKQFVSERKENDYIYGGKTTHKHQYPWQVGIVQKCSDEPYISCGGAILSGLTILTAAHCVFDYDNIERNITEFEVIVGDHDQTKKDGEEKLTVCQKSVHPEHFYDEEKGIHVNDFCILTLCNPVKFRHEVSPICLPEQRGDFYYNKMSTIAGWGSVNHYHDKPNSLQAVDIRTMDNEECQKLYKDDYYDIDYTIDDNSICAFTKNKDTCYGDSGGPLITLEPPNYKHYSVIGVVSWGLDIHCTENYSPGVYARVTSALPWIKENIKGRTCKSPNE